MQEGPAHGPEESTSETRRKQAAKSWNGVASWQEKTETRHPACKNGSEITENTIYDLVLAPGS